MKGMTVPHEGGLGADNGGDVASEIKMTPISEEFDSNKTANRQIDPFSARKATCPAIRLHIKTHWEEGA